MRRFLVLFITLALLFPACKPKDKRKDSGQFEKDIPSSYTLEKIPADKLAAYKAGLNNLFDTLLLNRGFNGSVLVAKGGNILYEKYVGYANPGAAVDTINEHTQFHLASTSKPFTAMAVLKLVQENKIGLDDDIIKYFSGFPYSGVTVRDLLSHRSGLPNYLYFMDRKHWDEKKSPNNQDVLEFMLKNIPPVNYKPGTHFSYCNTNFVLLALIVEKVTGKQFPQYIKETIFDPLMMHDTFIYTAADSARVLMSYRPSNKVWENDQFERTYGDKNVYSTPRDLMKWDAALYDDHFIRQSLLDSAYQPLSNEKPSIHNYGLGWRMLNLKNGKKVIYHNGKWHGFTPAFARLTDERAVVIILGNKYNQSIYTAAKKVYNVFGDYMQTTGEGEDENASQGEVTDPTAVAPPAPVKKIEKPAVAVVAPAKTQKKAVIKPVVKTAASTPTVKKPERKDLVMKRAPNKPVPVKKIEKKK